MSSRILSDTEIDLSEDPISGKDLCVLLTRYPNLKKMTLARCQNIDEGWNLSGVTLSQLEEIDLSDTYISVENVCDLLKACPKLRKIDVSDCDFMEEVWDLSTTHLPQVEEITLKNAFISEEGVYALAKACPIAQFNSSSFDIAKLRAFGPPLDTHMLIIKRLSSYLMITKQYPNLLQEIQVGICFPLSELFLKYRYNWNEQLKLIQSWDGCEETITPEQKKIFEEIIQSIHDAKSCQKCNSYLGAYAKTFFNENPGNYIVSNNKHAIGIVFDDEKKQWLIYDSSFRYGFQVYSPEALYEIIEKSIGPLIAIYGNDLFIPIDKTITDKNKFLAHGGFLFLGRIKYRPMATAFLNSATHPSVNLTREALLGLMIKSNIIYPAWAFGLTSSDDKIKKFFKDCLRQLAQLDNYNFKEELKKSLRGLPLEEQTTYMALVNSILPSTHGIINFFSNCIDYLTGVKTQPDKGSTNVANNAFALYTPTSPASNSATSQLIRRSLHAPSSPQRK